MEEKKQTCNQTNKQQSNIGKVYLDTLYCHWYNRHFFGVVQKTTLANKLTISGFDSKQNKKGKQANK